MADRPRPPRGPLGYDGTADRPRPPRGPLAAPDPAHAGHDPLLVAAYAANDLAPDERATAERLLATCAACTELAADLRSIAVATKRLPTPARPRDFSLTAADAARLRPAGWRRVLGAFASPRAALVRPLAATLTTLGLAGLMLASLPGIVPALGPVDGLINGAGQRDKEDQLLIGPAVASPVPRDAAAPPDAADPEAAPNDGETGTTTAGRADDQRAGGAQDVSLVVSASFVVLTVGLGLFALSWYARRSRLA